jgi:nitrite reductase (NO-forming)
MNKAILAGLAAGVLVVGLVFSPFFNGTSLLGAANAVTVKSTGVTRHVTMIASEKVVQVAPDNVLHPGGIMYNAMVFNGTIPGPVVAVNQGDTIEFTLKNEGKVIHSIDFHAGIGPKDVLSGNVAPGANKTWTLHANTAGAFLYHCGADGLNGVWEHIANGMYGGIIVHAQKEQPAKEFYIVFGEIYNNADKGPFVGTNGTTGSFDIGKFINNSPDLVLTNGMAHKYVPAVGQAVKLTLNQNATVFKVKPGELTRWYIIDAGPNDGVSFHFIAGMIDVRDGSVRGNYGRPETQEETWWIPVGSGSVIESVFPQEGLYVGVDHNMSDVVKGGAFAVLATPDATDNDHPPGTWVPSKAWLEQHGAMAMAS